jgi:hypothetical protein
MQSRLPELRQLSGEILALGNNSDAPAWIAVSLLQSERLTSVSYTRVRYPLK